MYDLNLKSKSINRKVIDNCGHAICFAWYLIFFFNEYQFNFHMPIVQNFTLLGIYNYY